MVQLLRQKDFRNFWIGQLFTQLGDGLIRTVIIFLIAVLTQDPFMIGIVIFAQMLPMAVIGLFTGSLADRYSKKILLVVSNLFQLLVVCAMFVGRGDPWILLSLMTLYGVGISIYEPARSSSIPHIVQEQEIPKAVAFSQGSTQAMFIIAPGMAGLLFLINDFVVIFSIIAVTYLIAAIFLSTLRNVDDDSTSSQSQAESYLKSITTGVRQVFGIPTLRFLLFALIPITISAGVLNTNINTLFLQTFQVPADQFGFLQAIFGCGAVIGALVVPAILKKTRPGTMMMFSVSLLGLVMMLILLVNPLQQNIGLAAVYVWSILIGLLNASLNVPMSALFLQSTPRPFLGRGSALMQITINLGTMFGIVFGGWAAGVFTSLNTTAAIGGFMIVTALVLPLFKGFQKMNLKKVHKTDQDNASAIEGMLGRAVIIRRDLTDSSLIDTVFHPHYNKIMALLAKKPRTLSHLSKELNETCESIRKQIETLVQYQVIEQVQKEENEPYFCLNKDHHVIFNLNKKTGSKHKSVVMYGVRNLIKNGYDLLEKQFDHPEENYEVMLSTVTKQVTEMEWRQIHQKVADEISPANHDRTAKNQSNDEEKAEPTENNNVDDEGTYVFVLLSFKVEDSTHMSFDNLKYEGNVESDKSL